MSKTQATEQPKPSSPPTQGTPQDQGARTGEGGENAPALDDRHAMETAAARQEGDQPPEKKTFQTG